VEKKDNNTIRYLGEWFEEIWEEASEFDKDLMTAAIEKSQFEDDLPDISTGEGETSVAEVETISPYEATKRFIVEQFSRDVREGTLLQDITGDYEEQLTAFQQDAFRAARRPLEKYNGVVFSRQRRARQVIHRCSACRSIRVPETTFSSSLRSD